MAGSAFMLFGSVLVDVMQQFAHLLPTVFQHPESAALKDTLVPVTKPFCPPQARKCQVR